MDIKIHLEKLTIGDLVALDAAARGEMPVSAMVDLLDRVVEGGVRDLPLTALPEIVSALNIAVGEMANPKA